MAIIIIIMPKHATSHAPCAKNCACAEGLHFSAFHNNSNEERSITIEEYVDISTYIWM